MSENKINICPCCPKGCDLSNPHCGRGEEYLRTGVIPEKGNHSHHEENHHEEHCRREHRPNYEKMGVDEKLSMLLNRLGRAGCGSADGKSSQNRILHILSKSERMTQRELTEQLGIQPGSASEIIKKLETAGLITRQSNSEDRRTVDIALTDAGKAQAEAIDDQHGSHALFASLTDEEKQQLLVLLEKLGQDWHNRSRGEGRKERKHRESCKDDHKKDHDHKHRESSEDDHKCKREHKHENSREHNRGEKRGRKAGHDHEHGENKHRGHRHDSEEE